MGFFQNFLPFSFDSTIANRNSSRQQAKQFSSETRDREPETTNEKATYDSESKAKTLCDDAHKIGPVACFSRNLLNGKTYE